MGGVNQQGPSKYEGGARESVRLAQARVCVRVGSGPSCSSGRQGTAPARQHGLRVQATAGWACIVQWAGIGRSAGKEA